MLRTTGYNDKGEGEHAAVDIMTDGIAATCVPVALCQVSRVHEMLHVRKDEASEEAVAVATCTSNGLIHRLQLLDLGKKHRAARLVLCSDSAVGNSRITRMCWANMHC